MKISSVGLNLIKRFESLRLKAYYCPAGILTIGYGHTGPDVKPGSAISELMAEGMLISDLTHVMAAVNTVVSPLSQNQFDALCSLTFNIGTKAFRNSTMLRLLNDGAHGRAAAEFPRWNQGGGRVLPGLVVRRADERALFERA